MTQKLNLNSLQGKLTSKLLGLEEGEEFDIKEYIEDNYPYYDQFIVRSFDVMYCKAKKLKELRDYRFKRSKGKIKRIKLIP